MSFLVGLYKPQTNPEPYVLFNCYVFNPPFNLEQLLFFIISICWRAQASCPKECTTFLACLLPYNVVQLIPLSPIIHVNKLDINLWIDPSYTFWLECNIYDVVYFAPHHSRRHIIAVDLTISNGDEMDDHWIKRNSLSLHYIVILLSLMASK